MNFFNFSKKLLKRLEMEHFRLKVKKPFINHVKSCKFPPSTILIEFMFYPQSEFKWPHVRCENHAILSQLMEKLMDNNCECLKIFELGSEST